MLGKIKYILIFFIIFLNINIIQSVCIQGENCPPTQGYWSKSECICLYGFQTFIENQNSQNLIYCNYKQSYRWIPLIIEFLLPSFGLFVIGRTFHGIIKLFLFIIVCFYQSGLKNSFTGNCVIMFSIIAIVDIVCLATGFYYDGNGFPLL